jgi:hypothetical protein
MVNAHVKKMKEEFARANDIMCKYMNEKGDEFNDGYFTELFEEGERSLEHLE